MLEAAGWKVLVVLQKLENGCASNIAVATLAPAPALITCGCSGRWSRGDRGLDRGRGAAWSPAAGHVQPAPRRASAQTNM